MTPRRTDSATRTIPAPPGAVWRALSDPAAWARWLPPDGMTGTVAAFDLRPGGRYRLVLRHDIAGPGKTDAGRDVVDGRFTDVSPPRRLVHEVEFVSDDPAFAGTMTMTWTLAPAGTGTEVSFVAANVPSGISAEDHAAGLAASLANLAAHVLSDIAPGARPGPAS